MNDVKRDVINFLKSTGMKLPPTKQKKLIAAALREIAELEEAFEDANMRLDKLHIENTVLKEIIVRIGSAQRKLANRKVGDQQAPH